MNIRIGVFGILTLLAGVLRAEPVTPEMAKTAAAAWLQENPRAARGVALAGEEPRAEVAADGSVLWYEVLTDNGGCIITSSDTDVDPIISYVEEWGGPLPAEHPLRVLLAGRTSPDFIVSFIPQWREKYLTHWNQSSRTRADGTKTFCYNYYTPSNYVCGCVATAGSSMLQFFNVTKGPDPTVAHECGVNSDYHVWLKPIGGTYNWPILPLSWANKPGIDDEQIELMGHVAYDTGVCCEMGYSRNGSGANEKDLATAANGRPAWECYVAGLDPEDDLVVAVTMEDGLPKLDYARKDGRVYVEEGRSSLTEGDWHVRAEGDRFFRVSVSLPEQGR